MRTNRRTFIRSAAAAGAVAASTTVARNAVAADDKKLTIGVIGVGWYGMVDAKAALKVGGVEVTAICDVDREHLEAAAAELDTIQGSRPAMFADYQQMLEKATPDVVIIGTPPHWHALQLIAALQAGCNVYCEKPLTYDVREGQALVAAVNDSGKVVQVGFQRRQSRSYAEVKDFIAAGKAGRIVQADVQIHYTAGTKDPTPQPPPATLDWEQWCGPAPLIPYSPQVGHKSWRLEKTTGHGHLVDWGIHNIDATRMVLDLGLPDRITADGGIYRYKDIITTPDTLTACFEFDGLPVVWRHRLWGATETDPQFNNGIFFYGEDATIFSNDQRWVVFPKKGDPQPHEAKTDLGTNHMANFLNSVRGREALKCPIEQGFQSTATVQLGMIAYESGTVVHFDGETEQIKDNAAAGDLLSRDYRSPWKHPFHV